MFNKLVILKHDNDILFLHGKDWNNYLPVNTYLNSINNPDMMQCTCTGESLPKFAYEAKLRINKESSGRIQAQLASEW